MYTAQTENRKKRCAGETIRTKKFNSLRWHFRRWMVFLLILLHLFVFDYHCSYSIAFFSFLILLHILDTRTHQHKKKKIKKKTDPEDRNRKETNKTAFSNFTFEEEKKMHYEIENSLSFFLYVCFYVDGFFSILSYSVNWYIEINMRCVVIRCGGVWAAHKSSTSWSSVSL